MAARARRGRGNRGRRRDVRVHPPEDRRLPRRVGSRQGAVVEGHRAPRRSDDPQPGDVRAALDGGAAGPPLPAGVRRHPGLDRLDVRRSRRRRGRDGALVRDAARLGLRQRGRRARSRADGRLEPALHAGLPDPRARAAHFHRGRPHGARHGRLPRSGDLPRRGRGIRRCAQHSEARPAHRRPRGADRVVGQASDPEKASRVGRRVVRPLPGPDERSPQAPVARAHARHARGPLHGLPRAAHVASRARRLRRAR